MSTQIYPCRICENIEHNTTYEVREMMLGLRDMHTYFECASCGCLQIANVPENIQEYYPNEDYYSYDAVKAVSGIKGKLIKMRDRYAATGSCFVGRLMQRIQPHDKLPSLRHANVSLDSKILDVGCGAGHLLHSMQEAGFKNLLGIDPFNAKELNYDNGLKIEPKSIHDMTGKNEWDLIMFNHSFEHVFDQHDVLEKVMILLKSGGVCMIRVPTVTSWAWRSYGVDWVQLDAPRHLFLHSLQSMNELAEQQGFKLENVVYDSFAFQQWGSEQYKKDIALHDENSYAVSPEKSPFSSADIREYEEHSKELNESKSGDQAAFYLRKPA
ncbi:MAG: class I SAM-dependent methyltransferase [Cocleimonas sp.]|nr:class I SAM-dependent methyltransferase [Cocleimonas sp.]